jgi:hypothetical protein
MRSVRDAPGNFAVRITVFSRNTAKAVHTE